MCENRISVGGIGGKDPRDERFIHLAETPTSELGTIGLIVRRKNTCLYARPALPEKLGIRWSSRRVGWTHGFYRTLPLADGVLKSQLKTQFFGLITILYIWIYASKTFEHWFTNNHMIQPHPPDRARCSCSALGMAPRRWATSRHGPFVRCFGRLACEKRCVLGKERKQSMPFLPWRCLNPDVFFQM